MHANKTNTLQFLLLVLITYNCTDFLVSCRNVPTVQKVTLDLYIEEQTGDPFNEEMHTKAVLSGRIGAVKQVVNSYHDLQVEHRGIRHSIPAFGRLARVDFLNLSGQTAATGYVYLPNGLLVINNDDRLAGRYPELNKLIIAELTAKNPAYVKKLEIMLGKHRYSLSQLTEE